MIDTTEQITAIQLKIWLSKSPMERLKQMMLDNEALMRFWSVTHRSKANISDAESTNQVKKIPPSAY